jgi:glycosyltransferase involved in cell wall biosynthesis
MSADASAQVSRVAEDAPVVLHVMQSAGIGGAERHLLAILPALRALGWDMRFWGFTTAGGSEFANALAAAGIPVDLVHVGRMRSLRVTRELRRRVRALGPRIVHSHLFYADVHTQLALLGTGVRSVRTIHVGPEFIPAGLPRRVYGWAGSRADRTITVSEHMARLAPQLGFAPAERLRVVRYGIDPVAWGPTDDARASARGEFGVRDTDVVVACTSRLIAGKGQDTLIRAFEVARRSNTNMHLLVAGTGPEEERLRQLARDLLPPGSYRFTGFVPDVRRVVWASDIFVLPTHAELGEGFGIAALEAAAGHVAIIASDHAPLRELIEPETTGVIVAPGVTDELARALTHLANDDGLRARLADAATERVCAGFTHASTVAATDAVYRELVEHGP